MKPVTNILLIAAIICYVFLPFRTMELAGSITGLSYSAGLITENFSFLKTIFALLPFIACFGGVMFNYNKHRYWGIATAAVILMGIVFFSKPDFFFQSWTLTHDPELLGDQAAQIEGFKVKGLSIGYYTSSILMWLSLVSCIISLLPFKFNQTLERSIDDTFEKGKKSIGKVQHELHEEISHIESKVKSKKTSTPKDEPKATVEETSSKKNEDPTDYMPKDQRPQAQEQAEVTQQQTDEEKYADYMPK
ncbi:MAG: hypothetical protein Q4E41_08675 [Bacteroidales bacterium]|nr:hypothetical protein [Muribaculaceae bacterium]MDO4972150.1 hypothetical protein [Bacteroidales bacterium]